MAHRYGLCVCAKARTRKIRFTAQSKYRNVIIDIENKMYARINTPRGEELLVPVGYA